MFEPRGSLYTITLISRSNSLGQGSYKRRRQRQRDNSGQRYWLTWESDPEQQQQQDSQLYYEQQYYQEPEVPIHPALEFEIQTTERKELLPPSSSSSSLDGLPADSSLLLQSSLLSSISKPPYTSTTR